MEALLYHIINLYFSTSKNYSIRGVAIGSINAQLAAMVVGITKIKGLTSSPIANIINIGEKVATVAVLELSSVNKIIKATAINTSI